MFEDKSLDILKSHVILFFNKYVKDYIVGDLKRLGEMYPDKEGMGACAVPTAMALISAMELLGFLLNRDGRADSSELNIGFYINALDFDGERLFPTYYDIHAIEKIIQYRHGMMHHFFPKFKGKFAGICKDRTSAELFISFAEIADPEAVSLNVVTLQRDFENSVIQLESLLFRSTDRDLFLSITLKLKDFEFYLSFIPYTTTTVMPGTPQNPRRNGT